MFITIIDGSLSEYVNDQNDGCIAVKEPDSNKALSLARQFSKYGMTVVLENERDGE